MSIRTASVAVLHQGHTPPEGDGIRKPLKPGGYADSSADIACALQGAGAPLVVPVGRPDPTREQDWSFPDTDEGIGEALAAGASVLWANTVLYDGHPIEDALRSGAAVVGQDPAHVQQFDDKRFTNERLRAAGCPVAAALVVGDYPGAIAGDNLTEQVLAEHGLTAPFVVKPIRGRGSTGVRRVSRWADLIPAIRELLNATTEMGGVSFPTYGRAVIVEEYLPGDEVTISVLPPGAYELGRERRRITRCWALPPVRRFHHQDGVAPYSGAVAVTQNSRVLGPPELTAGLRDLCAHCERAAGEVGARMVIRIDCRQDRMGAWRLFDLNMKPNMTGRGRPGRDNQDSLTAMAARAIGWDYQSLIVTLLGLAWVS